ncbi:sugar ABC transporter substrate-binding protein [Deinococcus alpinitundrae]|uniref:sugar ABC transporter substrate-binding protein n=1 Tax=Deinococcus alpinitundrae TaxID=468913 RepID=UPI00137A7F2E|nr:substrate-binding domain-containing protein [Deinococcus alpinitundrae]
MPNRRARHLTAALTLSLLLPSALAADPKTVAILTPFQQSVTTNAMIASLQDQAKQRGWKTNVVDTKGDMGQLASRMEDVISSKVSAIVIVSTDPNPLKTQIQSANAAKIPVFGLDSGYIPGMAMNATSDNAAMGKSITNLLFKAMNGKGNLVVLTYRPHPGVLKRTQALDAALKNYPGIHVVTEQQVQVPGPIENSRQQMENILLANPGKGAITAVWTGWDEPAIGAAQAIQAAGRTGIKVTGIDGTSQATDMIQKGSPIIATLKQNFPQMAVLVAQQIDRVFKGQPVIATELYAPASLVTRKP